MGKQREFKLAFVKANGEIIEPLLENLAKERWTSKNYAEAFCAGVNAFREARPTHKREGNYIVVYA